MLGGFRALVLPLGLAQRMTLEGVVRCTGCGSWIMIRNLSCTTCKTITEKGDGHAETNQRGATMSAKETEKGDR